MSDQVVVPPPGGEEEEIFTLDEAVQFLGTSKPTLYRWLSQGDLKGLKVGKQWRFRRADLVAYMERQPASMTGAQSSELALEQRFFEELLEKTGAPVKHEHDQPERPEFDLATRMIVHAITLGASDIHFETYREQDQSWLQVRYRIDGVLHEIRRMSGRLAGPLIDRIKEMAEMNVAERRVPQDGRIPIIFRNHPYEALVASIPALWGESVTMRILDQASVLVGLDRLGLTPEDEQRLAAWTRLPNGLIIAVGPSGSGKTTTLYSCLNQIASTEIKVITIEDPVECSFRHFTQVPVNRKTGMTFPASLRSALRQDPDVIFVGEMRDLETAELLAEASLTGHLALTCLHTIDSASAFTRLTDIGVAPFIVAASTIGVVAQRLVRKICQECQEPAEISESTLKLVQSAAERGGYHVPEGASFLRGAGCDHCHGSGYRGRTGIFELLAVTDQTAPMITSQAPPDEVMEVAIAEGTRTLFADGIRKAVEGVTTVQEVMRVTGMST